MRPRSILAVALAATALLVACDAAGDRPDVQTWQESWTEARAAVPELSRLEAGDPSAICEDVLGRLRAAQPGLTPTPDRSLDGAVEGWIEIADETFFECPPRSEGLQGFQQAYRELDRFAREVEEGLR